MRRPPIGLMRVSPLGYTDALRGFLSEVPRGPRLAEPGDGWGKRVDALWSLIETITIASLPRLLSVEIV